MSSAPKPLECTHAKCKSVATNSLKTGSLEVDNLSVDDLNAGTAQISGLLTAQTAEIQSAEISGPLSAQSALFSGPVGATIAQISGPLEAQSASIDALLTGNVSANQYATINGPLTAQSVVVMDSIKFPDTVTIAPSGVPANESLTAADSGKIFDVNANAGQVIISLPATTDKLRFTFVKTNAGGSGDSITINGATLVGHATYYKQINTPIGNEDANITEFGSWGSIELGRNCATGSSIEIVGLGSGKYHVRIQTSEGPGGVNGLVLA